MRLPRNTRERDLILHGDSYREMGTRNGLKMAEKYNAVRPGKPFAVILETADSLRVSKSLGNEEAYKLSFLITYCKLEGYQFPFTTEVVTSDHLNERNTTGMLNKIMLIGNLGRDPELNVTGDGTPVTRFSVAVTRRYKSGGESREETEWFNVVAWRQLAEICDRYLTKGSKVYVEGRLTQRKYTDKEGIQRTSVEVIANEMEMLTPKGGNGNGTERREEVERVGAGNEPFLPDYPDDLS